MKTLISRAKYCPPYGSLMAAYNSTDWEQKKRLAEKLAGLK